MKNGTVKFFNTAKAFGFIKCNDTDEEVFVHITGLNDETKGLQEGQQVTYEIEKDPKSNRTRAVNVTVI